MADRKDSVLDVPREFLMDLVLSKYFEHLFQFHLSPERDAGLDDVGRERQAKIRTKIKDLAFYARTHPEGVGFPIAGVGTLVDILVDHTPFLPGWLKAGLDEVLGQAPRTIVNVLKQAPIQAHVPEKYEPESQSAQEALAELGPILKVDLSWVYDFIQKYAIHWRKFWDWIQSLYHEGLRGFGNVVERTIIQDLDGLYARVRAARLARRAARGVS